MRYLLKSPLFVLVMAVFLAFSSQEKPIVLHASARGQEQSSNSTWVVTQIGNELQIAYGSGANFPQYGALHLDSGYFRLNYSPSSGWGPSIVLPPAFWSGGSYYQGTPITATWQIVSSNLVLSVTGTIASLNFNTQINLLPPVLGSITAQVSTAVEGSVPLDNRPGEAFKPIMLSSMHISSTMWDSQTAFADCQTFTLPVSGWIIQPQPPLNAQIFGLIGGTSSWKTNAPTIWIILDQPRQVAGWVTPSSNPNDDNVGLWTASDVILSSWTFNAVATAGLSIDCIFLPSVLRN